MFPEPRLSHEGLKAVNGIGVKGTWVLIVAKIIQIGQSILPQFAPFPRVDAHCVGHFIQSFEYSVG